MDISEREELIKNIEEKFNTKVIVYITVDRINGPGASIAKDILNIFQRHLDAIGVEENITLFLYSTGGDVDVPWRLVTLIREYCRNFNVIVPYKAHSAATLICLGANEIIMGKMSELSPVDPSTSNAFNPDDPKNPLRKIPITVEDVSSFIQLVKREFEKNDNAINQTEVICNIFKQLTDKIHPLALGNVQRAHSQIRDLSKKLLGLHMKNDTEEDLSKIEKVVNILTEKLYSHNHMIPRYEAKNIIGLNVKYLDESNEDTIKDLFNYYKKNLNIGEMFNPLELLGEDESVNLSLIIALLETLKTEDQYSLEANILKQKKIGIKPNVQIIKQGWQSIR